MSDQVKGKLIPFKSRAQRRREWMTQNLAKTREVFEANKKRLAGIPGVMVLVDKDGFTKEVAHSCLFPPHWDVAIKPTLDIGGFARGKTPTAHRTDFKRFEFVEMLTENRALYREVLPWGI